jgi:hypothetical protein
MTAELISRVQAGFLVDGLDIPMSAVIPAGLT